MQSLAALYIGGVLLGLGLWWTYNVDPGLVGRYGLSVAPLLALSLVAAVRGKWILRTLWGFSLRSRLDLRLHTCHLTRQIRLSGTWFGCSARRRSQGSE